MKHYHPDRYFLILLKLTAICVFVLVGVSCGGIPIATHPLDQDFIEKKEAQLTIGAHKNDVLQKYGKPEWEFYYKNNNYLLYSSFGEIDLVWDVFLPYLVLPGSLYDSSYIYCALVKFDQLENVLDVEHESDVYYGGDIVPVCLNMFFSKHEAELLISSYKRENRALTVPLDVSIESTSNYFNEFYDYNLREELFSHRTDAELQASRELGLQALKDGGEADDYLKLYYSYRDSRLETALIYLCKSADKGHPHARYRVAQLYEQGNEGFKEDFIMAYVWYVLAGELEYGSESLLGCREALHIKINLLSNAEVAEARKVLEEWQPGQCELAFPHTKLEISH